MGWEEIEKRVRENDEDREIGLNPLRGEVVTAMKKDSRVAPDSASGQDKKMVFVRVGGPEGALVGVQISNKTSIGLWCDSIYLDALGSAGFRAKYKVCERKPGSNNTGRHSGLDRPNRFDDVPLVYTELAEADAALRVIDVVASTHIDWSRFWTGFLEEVDLPLSLAGSLSTLDVSIDPGARVELQGRAPGPGISARLVFDSAHAEARYLRLLSLCGRMEERLGSKLNWGGTGPDPGSFSVTHSMMGLNLAEMSKWADAYTFFKSTVEKFRSSVSDIARLEGA